MREKERVLQHSVKALTDALSNREASLTRPEQVPFMYETVNAARQHSFADFLIIPSLCMCELSGPPFQAGFSRCHADIFEMASLMSNSAGMTRKQLYVLNWERF